MVQGFGMNCMKWSVVAANLLLILIGLTMVGVGVYMSVSESTEQQIRDAVEDVSKDNKDVTKWMEWMDEIGYAAMGLGGLLVVLGLLALIGAWKENRALLAIYFGAAALVALGGLACGVYLFAFPGDAEKNIDKAAGDYLDRLAGGNGTARMGQIEKSFECCGVDGTEARCAGAVAAGTPGCKTAVGDALQKGVVPGGIAVFGSALFMVVSMVFVCCLWVEVGKRSPYEKHA